MDLEKILACPVCNIRLNNESCIKCNINFSKKSIYSFICKEIYPDEQAYKHARSVIDFWGNGWRKRLKEDEHKFIYDLNVNELKKYGKQSLKWQKENKTLLGEEVCADSLEDKITLNIGCGSGIEAIILGQKGASCIAMDITKPAAEATDRLLRKLNYGFAIQADARFIPIQNDSVDILYSSGVLHHSSNISKSISEIYRVLKPGGTAYIMLYAFWSIIFLQETLFHLSGEKSWEVDGSKNPLTTKYSVAKCHKLFSAFGDISISKRNASFRHLAKIGRFMPTIFDKYIDSILGANINIVAKKVI